MGVYEGRGQLDRAMKDLMARWMDTKSSWRDAVAHKFEEEVLVSLARELRDATSAMDTAAQTLAQVRNDCR
jgi:DNA phosphorothioation-dependent restriction protein DptG